MPVLIGLTRPIAMLTRRVVQVDGVSHQPGEIVQVYDVRTVLSSIRNGTMTWAPKRPLGLSAHETVKPPTATNATPRKKRRYRRRDMHAER